MALIIYVSATIPTRLARTSIAIAEADKRKKELEADRRRAREEAERRREEARQQREQAAVFAKLAQPEPPRLADQPDYPAPVPMRPAYAPRPRNVAGTLAPLPTPAEDASRDDLRAWVLAMVDERGYSQSAVARLLGRSRQWINQLYKAGRNSDISGGE